MTAGSAASPGTAGGVASTQAAIHAAVHAAVHADIPADIPAGIQADPAPAALTPAFAALVLALLMGLQPVTTDLMLPALPALAADLHAPMAPVQLTMAALILAFGLAQLVWGPLADRVGRRPVLLTGLALYVLASAGAALASHVMAVVGWRALQGAAMSAAVVCARAMVRDLYGPREGAMVMARALTGLGGLAIASPVIGGALVAGFGWRAAVVAMGVAGAALAVFIALRLPETARFRAPEATHLRPLARQIAATLGHPAFRAWTALLACSYGGLFVFLAGSGFVLIGVLGLTPGRAGLVMGSCSLAYIGGTLLCRRWIPGRGLTGAVARGAWFTAAAGAALLLLAATDARSVIAVMLPVWLYALGHGVLMPCGQAGAVGPFPRAAGLASALAGFVTAAVAFGTGLWLGRSLDGTVRPFALAMATAAGLTALVAWTLVQRDGNRLQAEPTAA
jgi:DHA1 family bicyclomycin/chloramphenicol resistance-like MFS transporter